MLQLTDSRANFNAQSLLQLMCPPYKTRLAHLKMILPFRAVINSLLLKAF